MKKLGREGEKGVGMFVGKKAMWPTEPSLRQQKKGENASHSGIVREFSAKRKSISCGYDRDEIPRALVSWA